MPKFCIFITSAGSRCENYDQLGASHVVRASAALTNANSTGFALVRNLGQIGGNLSASSDRETLSYSVDLNRNELETGLKYLLDASTQQQFREWDLGKVAERVIYETKRQPDAVRAVELLHSAAFHGELGNSLFCSKKSAKKFKSNDLQDFVNANCTASRAAVVGVGIDHDLLLAVAKHLNLEAGAANVAPSKFNVGDVRKNKLGNWATVAIGTQGAALSNQKEAIAFAVLQQIAGTGVNIQNGSPSGALGKVLGNTLGNSQFGFTTLNASYSDNGLFGVVLVAEANEIGKVKARIKFQLFKTKTLYIY